MFEIFEINSKNIVLWFDSSWNYAIIELNTVIVLLIVLFNIFVTPKIYRSFNGDKGDGWLFGIIMFVMMIVFYGNLIYGMKYG